MFGVCMRLSCVRAVLCSGRALRRAGVLPSMKNDYGTEKEAWALNGLEESLKEKKI
jgi:hypothetical protein